jgi:hypothetical protein
LLLRRMDPTSIMGSMPPPRANTYYSIGRIIHLTQIILGDYGYPDRAAIRN